MIIGKNFRLLLAFFTLFAPLFAQASGGIHHLGLSPRALGMGDAFVAVANDYSGIFYNPAALAWREESETNLNMDFVASPTFGGFISELGSGAGGGDPAALADILNKYNGDTFSGRAALFNGTYVAPKWGIAFTPFDFSVKMTPHPGQVGPILDMAVYLDTVLAISYGDYIRDQYNGRLAWGITGKFVNRGALITSVSTLDLAMDPDALSANALVEGYTLDADVGFLWTPAFREELYDWVKWARPTFGLVVRNIAQSSFKNSLKIINPNSTGQPEQLYRVVDIGSKWEYPEIFLFRGRGVLDIRDLMHPNFSSRKGLHWGFEFDWVVSNYWKGSYRIGMSQGFLTAGISAKLSAFNLDFVTFAEDIGTFTVPVEARQYMLRLNMNF